MDDGEEREGEETENAAMSERTPAVLPKTSTPRKRQRTSSGSGAVHPGPSATASDIAAPTEPAPVIPMSDITETTGLCTVEGRVSFLSFEQPMSGGESKGASKGMSRSRKTLGLADDVTEMMFTLWPEIYRPASVATFNTCIRIENVRLQKYQGKRLLVTTRNTNFHCLNNEERPGFPALNWDTHLRLLEETIGLANGTSLGLHVYIMEIREYDGESKTQEMVVRDEASKKRMLLFRGFLSAVEKQIGCYYWMRGVTVWNDALTVWPAAMMVDAPRELDFNVSATATDVNT